MSIRPVDFAMVQRSQDVAQMKQNENTKPFVEQQNIGSQVQKEVHRRNEQVVKKDDIGDHDEKYDARDKSKNEFYKDESKENEHKKQGNGRVIVKGQKNFDIKI